MRRLIFPKILIGLTTAACSIGGRGDYKIIATFPSPGGGHSATLWQGMGGGAAGWCNQRITVNRSHNEF
ncbi:MAG: hypothetical protein ABIU09_05080, partial [Pyrinomonadaceae bacterium]